MKDIYEIKKEIRDCIPSKRNDLYDSMLYWSQKAYNICDILISGLTNEGDLVFDPFLGSGVTLFQAIADETKRNAIGCEINDEPIFLIKTMLAKYDVKHLENRINSFLEYITVFNSLYQVTCPHCGKRNVLNTTCFDLVNNEPVLQSINFSCSCGCKSKQENFDDLDYMINHSEPIHYIRSRKLIKNSKIAVKENQEIKDIFTNRNYVILDKILEAKYTDYSDIADIIDYALLSILHLCKITDTHSNSQWPLWIPKKNCIEKNVIKLLSKKMKQIIKAVSFMEKHYSLAKEGFPGLEDKNHYCIIKKGVQLLSTNDLPDNSVNLVVTDPPYLGQVLYSEYMQLYYPFVDLEINFNDEIVVSSGTGRNKNYEQYFKDLDQAFSIIISKMKTGSYMCLYFHDSKLDVWYRLVDILTKYGLNYLSQIHIDKSNTVKNILSPKKSLNGDALLFFIKEEKTTEPVIADSIDEIVYSIVKEAKYMIENYGPQSTPELYDNGVMEIIISNNWLAPLSKKYSDLTEIFDRHLLWDEETHLWTVKEDYAD